MGRAPLVCLLGTAAAVVAHLAIRVAEGRARDVYRTIVGEDAATRTADDEWKDVRPLVASWGCLVTILEFIRGAGVLLALGAVLTMIVGP
ncbi:MAG: hypothetical protein PVH41_04000 [Anaerolineae bacterium]|jgi:hypothetical protein